MQSVMQSLNDVPRGICLFVIHVRYSFFLFANDTHSCRSSASSAESSSPSMLSKSRSYDSQPVIFQTASNNRAVDHLRHIKSPARLLCSYICSSTTTRVRESAFPQHYPLHSRGAPRVGGLRLQALRRLACCVSGRCLLVIHITSYSSCTAHLAPSNV